MTPIMAGSPSIRYTTAASLRTYMNVDVSALSDEEAERVILMSERDIDRAVGPRAWYEDGRKFNPPDMAVNQATALSQATCAQAEYRLSKSEEFFVEEQVPSGEFATTSIKEPRIGPKAREELAYGGLRSSIVRVV